MSAEENLSEDEEFYYKLDTIPPEVFLHICSFLSAKYVINVLSQVCKKFKDIIEDDSTWRTRIFESWPKRYPIVPFSDIDWKEACMEREDHYQLWKSSGENMKAYHVKEAHFGSVNIVKIIEDGRMCASGGRDGALKLWNISALKELDVSSDLSSCLVHSMPGAHGSAWLWAMTYDKTNKMVYTGGFDCHIKTWDVDHPDLPVISQSLPSPILSLAYHDNTLTAGCYGRSVSLIDPRVGLQPIWQHIHHRKPVICISSNERYVISGSEDKSIIVYDKSAKKILKTIKLAAFPLCMSHQYGQILAGDVQGFFHVIDATEGKFDLVKSYESGHKMKITGIQHSLGSIMTCSTDKTIRIFEPNIDPEPIAVLNLTTEISRISAYKTTLVCANTDDSITVWLPKEEYL